MMHLTDTPADYLTHVPLTAHAIAVEMRQHFQDVQVVRAAVQSRGRIPPAVVEKLTKLRFHAREAITAYAREDTSGAPATWRTSTASARRSAPGSLSWATTPSSLSLNN